MSSNLKLMCILAHPDDESLGTGGILAKYAAEGIKTYLVTATRGERGWLGDPGEYPGPKALGRIREAELYAAAGVLGVQEVAFLDYLDGELDQVDPAGAIARIMDHLRRVRPQVVVTFDPAGAYGHPDHVAISQFTTAAVVAAADPGYAEAQPWPPHRVSKLYYFAATAPKIIAYQAAFGELALEVDGVQRLATAWEPWAITTRIDTGAYWRQVWDAVMCHRSQLPGYEALTNLPEAQQRHLWQTETYYRALSLVNGGRAIEQDLFQGLRFAVNGRRKTYTAATTTGSGI
jgi:LmbE family N-acetylglucosaminyl deacetylase